MSGAPTLEVAIGDGSPTTFGYARNSGTTERQQNCWFLTRKARDLLYATDHNHPTPREEAPAAVPVLFDLEGEVLTGRQLWPCGSRPGAR